MTDRIIRTLHEINAALDAMAAKPALKVALLSVKRAHFSSRSIGTLRFRDIEFDVLPDIATLPFGTSYDICILCCHNSNEEPLLFDLRAAGLAPLYFVWLWDNHHHIVEQIRTSMLADCVFLSHWHMRDDLNHPMIFPGPHMPACARQWSSGLIEAVYPSGLPHERSDALFGGFGRYAWVGDRNRFIGELMVSCPDHALTLGSVPHYAERPELERLALWAGHKVQITVPVARDLSSRVFDALMTGQIPLVPTDVPDLDKVVPPALQAALPILRYAPGSVESANAAWREGVRRFDADGAAGVARRYEFARDHHSLPNRLDRFAAFIRSPGQFELARSNRRRFWSNWAAGESMAVDEGTGAGGQ